MTASKGLARGPDPAMPAEANTGPMLGGPAGREPPTARKVVRKAPPKPRRHGVYAAVWACSGLIAGAYVFALILRTDGGPLLARSERDGLDASALAKTQADVAQLQKSMGQIEGDVARIKVDQAQADEREKRMVGRVDAVESRLSQFSEQIAAAVTLPAAKTAKVPPAPPAQTQAQPQAQAQAAPAPASKTPAARIATAAIPAPQPAPAAPATPQAAQPPAGDSAGVLLARGPSLDALRLSWSLLNERHKGTLKSMEPRVVEVEPGTYQLLAGPVANPAEAMKVCAALKARGVSCQPSDFKGNAL